MQYYRVEVLAVVVKTFCPHMDINLWTNIPPEIQRRPNEAGFTMPLLEWRRWRRHRQQKQGKRTGIVARLKVNPHKPVIPSLFLTHSWSLNNKMDELRLWTDCHRVLAGAKHPQCNNQVSWLHCLMSRLER